MERVTPRRVRRLEEWSLHATAARVAAEHGLDPAELLAEAQEVADWCARWREQHGTRWVGGKIDMEPEWRAWAAAHGFDPDEVLAEARRVID